MDKQNKIIVRTKDLEIITGFKRQSLNRLVKENGLPKEGKGTWDLRKVFPWFINYKSNIAVAPIKKEIEKLREESPERRLTIAKARKEEIGIEKELKTLLPVDDIDSFFAHFASVLVNELYGTIKKYKIKLPAQKTDIERVALLQKLNYELLENLANTNATNLLPDTLRATLPEHLRIRKQLPKKAKTKRTVKRKSVGKKRKNHRAA